MVMYADIKSKSKELKVKLVDNFEIIGINEYVNLINDLTAITCSLDDVDLNEVYEQLTQLEQKIDSTIIKYTDIKSL